MCQDWDWLSCVNRWRNNRQLISERQLNIQFGSSSTIPTSFSIFCAPRSLHFCAYLFNWQTTSDKRNNVKQQQQQKKFGKNNLSNANDSIKCNQSFKNLLILFTVYHALFFSVSSFFRFVDYCRTLFWYAIEWWAFWECLNQLLFGGLHFGTIK